jgi:hypothetical protein
MVEKDWTPRDLGPMSIGQVICLLNPRAPDDRRISSGDDWAARQALRQAEADEWVCSAS